MSNNKTNISERIAQFLEEVSSLNNNPPKSITPEEWALAIPYIEGVEGSKKPPQELLDRIGIVDDDAIIVKYVDSGITDTKYYDKYFWETFYKLLAEILDRYPDVIQAIEAYCSESGIEEIHRPWDYIFYADVLRRMPKEDQRKFKLNLHLFDESYQKDSVQSTEKTSTDAGQTGAEHMGALELIPNNQALALVRAIIAKGGYNPTVKGAKLPTRSGDGFIYEAESADSYSIFITDIDFLAGAFRNRSFTKTLAYTLQLLLWSGHPEELDIELQDLVDVGLFSNVSNARTGIKRFFDWQTKCQFGGTIKEKNRDDIISEAGILFYHYKANGRGHVSLSVNQNLNPLYLSRFAGVFPSWAYQLDPLAFTLLWYVFSLARYQKQRNAIVKDGYFTVKIDTVRGHLGLPSIEEESSKHRKYKENIVTPLADAIDAINKASASDNAIPGEFRIEYAGGISRKSDYRDYLSGTLEIHLSGDYT